MTMAEPLPKKDIDFSDAGEIGDVESSASVEAVAVPTTARVLDHEAEVKLCRKFDIRMLPVLALMYLFNALDKGNLGNAKTAGLTDDLHFKSNQYNIIVSIFFIPYVLCAPPFAMLGKRWGAHRALPAMMLGFGSMTLFMAAAQNFSGVMAIRWFLGMSEAAFFPLVIYYLTTFYRRGELARRLAIFYAASNIANAFSGLLAFGVFQIHQSHLESWRYLFLIEGAASVLFSIFAFWYLPPSADTASFLNAEEKELAFFRIQTDSSAIVSEKFVLRDALKIFREPSTFAFLAIEVCVGVPLQAVSLFLPQIVAALNYSTVKTNLYTVAPNVTGAVMLLLLAFGSDLLRIRFPFIMLGFLFTFTGFIIYASISDLAAQIHLAYFATFMMCWGTSAPSVLLSAWFSNNIAHEGRRVTMTAVGVPLANVMGLVSSNIFLEKEAPKYETALITTAVFGGVGALLSGGLGLWMMWDNARRNRRDGVKKVARDVPTVRLRDGPSVAEFRWFL
ncbi:major facilitator superfamily domain-containing protein [Coniella lustricola]|uniref:Major facilitator superfamily domain-containing protein n=1 Tax=Coniella lustricola TaxID=2025994 RepID=A0A2T3A8W5_9PEZI|nr:major facilitator superfamily domain-containing protein [Coniella lustricola]